MFTRLLKYSCVVIFLLISAYLNEVSGQNLDTVVHFNGNSSLTVPNSPSISPQETISISCWLRPDITANNNSHETILSKRHFTTINEFSNFSNWEWHDATNASGLNDVRGFVGSVYDGRYIYCSPWYKNTDTEKESGKILRYDTHLPYNDDNSWEVYDAENEDGYSDIRGLEGAVFDGTYIYFVPLHHEGIYWAKVLRYDTRKDFSNSDSWDVFNAEPLDEDGEMRGFVGATFDGTNIYFIPNPFYPHGKVLRFNTKTDFFDPNSWSIFNLRNIDSNYFPGNGFFGGVFDGNYVYFVPFNNGGKLLRLNIKSDFNNNDSWSSIDFQDLFPNSGIDFNRNFTGGVFDGRYIYFSPATQGSVIRYDTRGRLNESSSWTLMNIKNLDGNNGVYGGVGPVFDGRFVYFPPMHGLHGRSGKMVAYDTYSDFTNISSWNTIDLGKIDYDLRGFEGAVFDGQYVYYVPMNFDIPNGKVVRYNTTPNHEISYELYYNKTSSSFGSQAQTVAFDVGTSSGVRSISLINNMSFSDGMWHHLVATYDGQRMRLYLDGVLNNEQVFNDFASINQNDADLSIGKLPGGQNGYRGYLNDLAIWSTTLNENNIHHLISNDSTLDVNSLQALWTFDEGRKFSFVKDASLHENNSSFSENISYATFISAGPDEVICPLDTNYLLQDYYPKGGEWSGNFVSKDGVFFSSKDLDDTETVLTYTIKKNYSGIEKTFTDTKIIRIIKSPQIINPPDFICKGTQVVLTATEGFKDYLWSNGDTTRSIIISEPGTFSVIATDTNGACSTQSLEATISWGPDFPVVEIQRINFYTLKSDFEGQKYQWYKNGEIMSDSSLYINILNAGEYTVVVQDSSGCSTDVSVPLTITEYELQELLNQQLSLSPNPTSGKFELGIHGAKGDAYIEIVNSLGERIYSNSIYLQNAGTVLMMDISGYSSGIYLIKAKTREFTQVRKILLK